MSYPNTTNCEPDCAQHDGCAMMQIFSLKLANHSAITSAPGAHIELYGFMAVRDLLLPLRNYVFHRTRADPLVLHPSSGDPSSPLHIPMAGPKRGIYLQAPALIEFYMVIKKGDAYGLLLDEDLTLIDGAATISELTPFHGAYTQRIRGDHGAAAVDVTLALLRTAVEARIQVAVVPGMPAAAGGMRLSVACSVSGIREEIQLFDGVVEGPGNLDRSFVVAVVVGTPLILNFKVAPAGDVESARSHRRCYTARVHGCDRDLVHLGFCTMDLDVQVSWANID